MGGWLPCVACGLIAVGAAADSPEARRFNEDEFRRGLQARGLTDLLEFYLTEYPPGDAVEGLLLRRELKLTQNADETRSQVERLAALKAADDILILLIRHHAEDLRVLNWRLEFARSLLYRHAQPHCQRILYGNTTANDRERVLQLTGRALEELHRLTGLLAQEVDRLDELPVREYDHLERAGYVDRIEQLQPQAEYLAWWVTFYRALARHETDRLRTPELKGLLEDLRRPSGPLAIPHEDSHIQAQSLLLAGMASRLLHDDTGAVGYCNRAITTVGGVTDAAERDSLQWVLTLAMLERVRALRDNRQFDQASEGLDEFRKHVAQTAAEDFRLTLLAALLERSVWRARAERAAASGDDVLARRHRERAVRSLAELANEGATYRDEVYGALFDQINPDESPASLPPLEQCALLAGLLRQASDLLAGIDAARQAEASEPTTRRDELEARRIATLDRAIELAQMMLDPADPIAETYRAEVLFNLAVARHHRGHRQESARRFLEVGREFPQFGRAEMAVNNAVQLASELYQDSSLRSRPEIQELYLDALRAVTGGYPGTEAARYWQFFLAQTLEETGELDAAAAEYDRVDEAHEHHCQALAAAVRCRTEALKAKAAGAPSSIEHLRERAKAVARGAQRLDGAVRRRLAVPAADADQRQTLRRLLSRAVLDAGEIHVVPGVDQPQAAIDLLEEYESRFPDQKDLIGRVLRVRVIAFEALGRLDEARITVPRYVRSDPVHAGPTLQGLFESIREDIDRLEASGREAEANAKAESALLLATQIREWALRQDPPLPVSSLYAVDLQLAEAHLRAREWEDARRIFERCVNADGQIYEDRRPRDLRAIHGLAESLYGLGRFDDALPLFNGIVRGSGERDAMWWKALLRDLQCRAEQNADPDGIVKVIRQHRFLDPRMGGESLRACFDELERASTERLEPPG
ncbi:MAG: tetratricopeptide repeat protein [Phycisphaerales bacterium]|nr:MAG: tetratricopeptide repeat protein [Phycisphaerales bacterium]